MVPYHRQWQEHPNQLARTAQVLDLWSQADHWPADAFRDHFLSHMYKLSLSEAPRDGMRQLAQAKTQPEIDSAGYQLGRAIGVYGPDQWAKDSRLLPTRARRALDPQGLSDTLAALHDHKQRTELEWDGLDSLCSRSIKAPVGFEKPALHPEYCLVVPKPAAKPGPKPEGELLLARAPEKALGGKGAARQESFFDRQGGEIKSEQEKPHVSEPKSNGKILVAQDDGLDFSGHGWDRISCRGLTPDQVIDTIKNGKRALQPNGNTRCIGNRCTVILSPEGRIVTIMNW